MSNKGFTLLELMVASAILMVVVGVALMFSMTATEQTAENMMYARTEQALATLLTTLQEDLGQSSVHFWGNGETIRGELAPWDPAIPFDQANPVYDPPFLGEDLHITQPNTKSGEAEATPAPDHGSGMIQFRKVIGYDSDAFCLIWGPPIRYELISAQDEIPHNGRDDNGNGLVDEFVLARIEFTSIEIAPAEPTQPAGTQLYLNTGTQMGTFTPTLTGLGTILQGYTTGTNIVTYHNQESVHVVAPDIYFQDPNIPCPMSSGQPSMPKGTDLYWAASKATFTSLGNMWFGQTSVDYVAGQSNVMTFQPPGQAMPALAIDDSPDNWFTVYFSRDKLQPVITVTLTFFTEEGFKVDPGVIPLRERNLARTRQTRTFRINLGGI